MIWTRKDQPKTCTTKIIYRFALFPKTLLIRDHRHRFVYTPNGHLAKAKVWLQFYPVEYIFADGKWRKNNSPYILHPEGTIQATVIMESSYGMPKLQE